MVPQLLVLTVEEIEAFLALIGNFNVSDLLQL